MYCFDTDFLEFRLCNLDFVILECPITTRLIKSWKIDANYDTSYGKPRWHTRFRPIEASTCSELVRFNSNFM